MLQKIDGHTDAGVAGRSDAPPIWTFVALDCVSFGLFFVVFMFERIAQRETFDRSSQLLDVRLGLLNTGILITSSWLVALANHEGRSGNMLRTRRLLIAATLVGSGFAVVKAIEYSEKFNAGVNVLTNDFFTFYFALTGVHLLHYAIGLVGLCVLISGAKPLLTATERSRYMAWLDGGALFWHLVDLLWVFLFALLYLVGAR